jgi:UDP-2-acetamido-2-deoxy-ribo-hexuluronate aminotransferase
MQFIDLTAQQRRIRSKIEKRLLAVLDHGRYIFGPEIEELEQKLADYVGVKHAVACASGTDALLMALMTQEIGPGDAVFTTPFTFFATAEVICLLGATPVFVDIDDRTFNISPAQLESAIAAIMHNDRSHPALKGLPEDAALIPKAVMPVDLFGQPADYDAILATAERYGLFVVEDAAQSFGAQYKGRRTCGFGDVGCTSFFPAKPLGCYGDGGMCFTDRDDILDILHSLRVHGQGTDKYDNVRIGINGRMDSFQAAVLLEKLAIFDEELRLRERVAERYQALLDGGNGLRLPRVMEGCTSNWAQYSILASSNDQRTALLRRLNARGIPAAIYYPIPLHLQKAFRDLGYSAGDFPVSERCAERIFSIPMHPYLQAEEQQRVAEILGAQFEKGSSIQ